MILRTIRKWIRSIETPSLANIRRDVAENVRALGGLAAIEAQESDMQDRYAKSHQELFEFHKGEAMNAAKRADEAASLQKELSYILSDMKE